MLHSPVTPLSQSSSTKTERCVGTKKKNTTARDVTGFYAYFSPANRAIFSTSWGDFLTKWRRKPGEKRKNPVEKTQKKSPVETEPQNYRFLSFVVVERVLIAA